MQPYYQDDFVTLYHGDCLELSDLWCCGDVLVSDPPYGMSLKSGMGGEFGDCSIVGDESVHARDAALTLWGDSRPSLVFGRWSEPKPEGVKQVLTWNKGEHTGMGDLRIPWKPNTEEIYVSGRWPERTVKRSSSVLRYNAQVGTVALQHGRSHPTQKPLDLMTHLVSCCPEGVIVDPFAGSGSTLVAAKALGRKVIGVELLEKFCDVIVSRCSQGVLNFDG